VVGQSKAIMDCLMEVWRQHARDTKTYELLDRVLRETIAASVFSQLDSTPVEFGHFGNIVFPYASMGAVTSLDLFGLDEMILFSFYWSSRHRYSNAVDIGANLGLHSILMSRCGWSVKAYEPDPLHFSLLQRNLDLNSVVSVQPNELAVSGVSGEREFVRVVGNTTSSHLAGAKQNAYGDLVKFKVSAVSIEEIMRNADFIKLDAEGAEREIVLATTKNTWSGTDMMLEVGSELSAYEIYDHLSNLGVPMFSQKCGWSEVGRGDDMPTSYRDGSLFVGGRSSQVWE